MNNLEDTLNELIDGVRDASYDHLQGTDDDIRVAAKFNKLADRIKEIEEVINRDVG